MAVVLPQAEHKLSLIELPNDANKSDAVRRYVEKAQRIGIETVEELDGVAQVAHRELEAYFGISAETAIDSLGSLLALLPAASQIPAAALEQIESANYELGVDLDQVKLLSTATAAQPPTHNPPPQLDLTKLGPIPPVRDQGQRGACVAFATLAAYDFFSIASEVDYSEQFMYWNCKQNDGIPNEEGTWLGVAYPLLKRDGACFENTWPYVPQPIPGNVGQGPCPPAAIREALKYRPDFEQLAPTDVDDIKRVLQSGRFVSFSIPVFRSWHRNPQVAHTGNIGMPVPGEVRSGGHAMCFVGYVDMPDANPVLGGGRFILRNSWGTNWAVGRTTQEPGAGAGYGTIPYAYIAKYCAEAYCIKK